MITECTEGKPGQGKSYRTLSMFFQALKSAPELDTLTPEEKQLIDREMRQMARLRQRSEALRDAE